MPIISKVGTRSLKVRLAYGAIYAVLALGSVTMIYPFLLMLSGSVKSEADSVEYTPYPQFWFDDVTLFQKYVESKYNVDLTLGEAACAAQSGLSWQTTVIGDPLYRPFGRSAQRMHEDLVKRQSPLLEWSHLRIVNLNLATGSTPAEAITYLEHLPELAHSALLNQKLGDLLVLTHRIAPAAVPGAAPGLAVEPYVARRS